MDDDSGNDKITVTFTYTQDGAARLLHVDYLRGTGEVTGLSDVRDNSVAQNRTESPKGPLLADAQLEEMARGFLMSHYGETDPRLKDSSIRQTMIAGLRALMWSGACMKLSWTAARAV